MKVLKKASLACMAVIASLAMTASTSSTKLPSVNVKTMQGKTISTSAFSNGDKPIVINFWATWCKPCILELNNISEVYPDWQEKTGVKIIAISIDDARNVTKVAPFVKGRGWEYEVYIDENSEFRRAMNVQNPPHTFVLNGKGEVVWQHNGYAPGDEKKLYEVITKVAAGQKVK